MIQLLGAITGTPTAAGSFNYTFKARNAGGPSTTSATLTINISKGTQTITFGALSSKVYGTAPFALGATSNSGLAISYVSGTTTVATVSGSNLTLVGVGSSSITASQAGDANWNAASNVSQTQVVTAKGLTITGITANDKPFDGTTTATLSGTPALNGVVAADLANVTLGGTPIANFTSSAVGNNIPVTVTGYTISGSASGNYTLAQPTGLNADITATPAVSNGSTTGTVGIAFTTYNLSTLSTNSPSSYNYVSGALPGGLSIDLSTGAITGTPTAAGTFTYTFTATNVSGTSATSGTLTLTIAKGNQTITFGTLASKVYGTVPGTLTATSSAGLTVSYNSGNTAVATISGSTITYAAVGSSLITASQAGDANWNAATNVSQTQLVTAKALTVTGLSASDRVYDRGTSATITGTGTLSGIINSDVVTLIGTPTGTFSSKTVGTNKTVTISGLSLGGTDAGNYTLTAPTDLANITALALTISSAAANDKTYNGNNTAVLTGTLAGVISGDVVTLSLSGTFASVNAGNNIAVTSTSTMSGADAANYTLTQPTGLNADIIKANQTITFGALSQVTVGTAPFSLTATASSGLAVTYVSNNPAVATVSGSTITIVGAGTANITASQAGNGNYNAAADVMQPQTVVTSPIANLDDFTRANSDGVGNGWSETESASHVVRVQSGQLWMHRDNSSFPTNGREWLYRDVSSLYPTKYVNSSAKLQWVFNMHSHRAGPSGFDSGNYGTAFIIGSTSSDITNGNGNGYAVILGGVGSPDPIELVRFSGGLDLNSDVVNVIASWDHAASPAFAPDNNYFSIKVTYDPATNTWELYARNDGISAFADPTTITSTDLQDSGTDATYENTDLPFLGVYWNRASGGASLDEYASFDNIWRPNVVSVPTAFNVTGGTNCGNTTVGVSSSETGVSYQLVLNGTNTGSPVAGTNSAITFGPQTTTGTYTVVGTNSAGSTTMTGSAVVNAVPAAVTVSGGTTQCGGSVVLTASGGAGGTIYYQGTTSGGTNITNTTNPQTVSSSGTYFFNSRSSAGCFGPQGSAVVNINPLPTSTFTVSGGGSYCSGSGGLAIGLSGSQNTVNYQLKNGSTNVGSPVGGTGSNITFGAQTVAGTYTVVATTANNCTATMTGSKTIAVNSIPTITSATSNSPVCAGSNLDLTINGSNFSSYVWTNPSSATSGQVYQQDFNNLPRTGSSVAWVDNSTLPGWYINSPSVIGTNGMVVGDGTSVNGDSYSFGTTGATDRAFGSLASINSGTIQYGMKLTNNTGAPINRVYVQYTGEQWRDGGPTAVANTMSFTYSTNATSLTTGTYNGVSALDFTSPVLSGTATDLDGTLPANSTLKTATITLGTPLASGGSVWLKWSDIDDAGFDMGLAVDNLTVMLYNSASTLLATPNGSNNTYTNSTSTGTLATATYQATNVTTAGNYNVTAYTLDGCTATASTSVTLNPLPTATATNTGPYVVGQTIALNGGTGAASYAWGGPNSYSTSGQNQTIPNAVIGMSGTYTVTATSAAGCTASATTNVVVGANTTLWTAGANNTDWFTSSNWTNGVPNTLVSGIIPATNPSILKLSVWQGKPPKPKTLVSKVVVL